MKPKLEYASHGAFVSEAQNKLNALLPGVTPLKADGKYGEKTVARVKQFQKSRGLVADGIVGAKTWAALDSEAPGVPSAPSPPATPSSSHPEHFKGKKVHIGSSMMCTFGTQRTPIMLLSPTEPAKVGDCKPFVNIIPFGKCLSAQNPGYLPPVDYKDPFMDVSLKVGNDKPAYRPPCKPEIMTPWLGAFTKDQKQVIDKTATCKCKHGGIISFK